MLSFYIAYSLFNTLEKVPVHIFFKCTYRCKPCVCQQVSTQMPLTLFSKKKIKKKYARLRVDRYISCWLALFFFLFFFYFLHKDLFIQLIYRQYKQLKKFFFILSINWSLIILLTLENLTRFSICHN